jgi:hypothetical protein
MTPSLTVIGKRSKGESSQDPSEKTKKPRALESHGVVEHNHNNMKKQS